MPFFSIVIPVYNVAPYLRECLDSVLAQTFTDWEAICVDDGSTDGSGAILDEYAAKDSRFKVFHKENGGVSSARNLALNNTCGEWIGFLDADDVWGKDWLSKIQDNVADGIDWIRTGWTDWDMSTGVFSSKQSVIAGVGNNIFMGDVLSFAWHLISRCSFPIVNFYRKKLVTGIYFRPGIRFREDALFCYEVAMKSQKLKIVQANEYFRRERFGSATFSPRQRDDSLKVLTAYSEIWEKLTRFDNWKGINRQCLLEASTFWVAKDVREWYCRCLDKTDADCICVKRCVAKLLKIGAIGWRLRGTRLDCIRWLIFFKTKWFRVLLMSLRNPLGKIRGV